MSIAAGTGIATLMTARQGCHPNNRPFDKGFRKAHNPFHGLRNVSAIHHTTESAMSYQAAINAIEQARKDVVPYLEHAPEANMQVVRELVAQWGCQSVYMGANLCVYAPGTVARFCVSLETLEVGEIIEHKF